MKNVLAKKTFLGLWLLLVVLPGCGGSDRPKTYPATGKVIYRGQPVPDAEVTFVPTKGPMASGKTDAQGQFQLSTFSPNDGAVAGEYTVLVVKKEKYVDPRAPSSPYEMYRNLLPARYSSLQTSPLKATIKPESPNQLTLELTD
ncbi:MAG: DUF4198 domain-containing protein [Thermoguttaceae bacterium]|nr:DUF4198 domain-containing protein [Thermoguttaceae bacterium]MDW8039725.1 hypothetical protein [Thermoguttaceae bacterium]